MKSKIAKFAASLAAFFLFLSTLTGAVNAQQFSTEYNLNFDMSENGTTLVSQDIEIINLEKDVIATNFSLTVNGMSIYDVKVYNEKEDLPVDIKKDKGQTIINTEFKEYIIGLNKRTAFTVEYKTNDIASKVGNIWNVFIPKVQNVESAGQYNVILSVPKSFGPLIHLSPQPLTTEGNEEKINYYFNKVLLAQGGINGSFGRYQTLNYKLEYLLQNDTFFDEVKEIALPPDIPGSQKVYYRSLKPKPEKIVVDKDGNYLARYKVDANSVMEIVLHGSVDISGKQIVPSYGGSFEKIPQNLKLNYTGADEYWEVNSPSIQDTANKLLDKQKTVSENAQKVYEYVTTNLEYDFENTEKDSIERNGALAALSEEKKWACMEFTDLFIAITRAMGIPAREINGYAYAGEGQNTPLSISFRSGDVLHAWPQYYDPAFGWVAVDPTWGATSGLDYFTKLDSNHFAFVVKGVDSEYPLPAGAYKIVGDEKQVEVDFSLENERIQDTKQVLARKVFSLNPMELVKGKSSYLIYNPGPTTLFKIENQIEALPAYSLQKVKVEKNSLELDYLNIDGDKKTMPLELTTKKLPGESPSNVVVYTLVIVAALVLCTSLYALVIHSKDLKKLPFLRDRHPQDQDQLSNQNSQ